MNLRNRLLLVTEESDTIDAVASSLGQNGRFESDCVCRNLRQLVERLEPSPPAAVLVDIDPHPGRILAELDPIITRFSGTRFVVLSSDRCDDLMLEAMQIGARNFLVKHSIPADLPHVVSRLIANGAISGGPRGTMITVLSAGGGCGATTIAVNLAQELHLCDTQPALLVDLDCCYGGVAGYLGLDGRYGIADILANPGRLDPVLISSSALVYSEGLQVLISPASTNLFDAAPPDYRHLGDVLHVCRHTYRYTVIDAPRLPIDAAASLARTSDQTLVVFQMTVKDVQRARAMISALTHRGVASQQIVPLASRYRKRRSMISLKDVQAALGGNPVTPLRNDFRSAIRSLNYGQPLSAQAPRSPLRRDLKSLAAAVVATPVHNGRISAGR